MADLSGVDLCALPLSMPPEGQISNFVDPSSLAPIIVAVCAVIVTSALLITAGRLFANWKQLAWSDYLPLTVTLLTAAMTLLELRIARHPWDIRACWVLGDAMKVVLARSLLGITATFLSKVSIFLLFHQIFAIERRMQISIWAGLTATFLVFAASVGYQLHHFTPIPGTTWNELALSGGNPLEGSTAWAVVSSVLNLMLELYVFLLPLPTIATLSWSTRKRLKASAVFSTGLLAVVATVLSFVYRLKMAEEDFVDKTWNAAVVLLCLSAEVHITIIVSSMPGFSKFVRVYVVRKTRASNNPTNNQYDKNRPRTKGERRLELSDSWLFKSNATVEVSADTTPGCSIRPPSKRPSLSGTGLGLCS
ncbi:hypothetical protein C8A00DRAFT_44434 [Chaetomidium leptoderma]|uniref:Rhodopsin domain-containing protein n=1 Tax=Chaetomidium leptoderma TaxID=669021 RepID=A0AAN6VJ77_9PEZI|nr:hypothetical protein C8A00DRAFT_44434 [Chaetomidium leptoderma]